MPGTVSVACKLPHGLKLRLQEPFSQMEPVMGGGLEKRTYHRFVGDTVVIKGWAHKLDEDEARPIIVGGFAITSGVDADFFQKWKEQNADADVLKNGFIIAHEKPDSVHGRARDHKDDLSGFERTNPTNLPIEFKGKIATADVR